LQAARERIVADYEGLNYASVIRMVTALADEANRYVDEKAPWTTIKTDAELTRTTLTAVINAVRILTVYLKPVLPRFAERIERFLKIGPLAFGDAAGILEGHTIGEYERLAERVEKEKVDAMVEESRDSAAPAAPAAKAATLDEPIAAECTIEDFMKVDLRVATVVSAGPVEGADKLLHLELDIGGVRKSVFAGIAKAYRPEDLVGRQVVCVANLKPRKMKFGVSEGMVLASGPGGSEVFMLGVDEGAKAGERVH